jgi:hypothetical protein
VENQVKVLYFTPNNLNSYSCFYHSFELKLHERFFPLLVFPFLLTTSWLWILLCFLYGVNPLYLSTYCTLCISTHIPMVFSKQRALATAPPSLRTQF